MFSTGLLAFILFIFYENTFIMLFYIMYYYCYYDSIPVLSIIETFGYLSGYKVNMNKTIGMPLGNLPMTCNIPFTWSGSGFKYLGIHISLFCYFNILYSNCYQKMQMFQRKEKPV
uniref:Uncharacterized protein n=1 Tax=Neolamprologus brichardi TaxID=32507 RepID=A0A3Q4GJN8_NEOBR